MTGIRTNISSHIKETIHDECAPKTNKQTKKQTKKQKPYWKRTLIVPVFPKGNRSVASITARISLTTILCKLCEYIILCNHRSSLWARHPDWLTAWVWQKKIFQKPADTHNPWPGKWCLGERADWFYLTFMLCLVFCMCLSFTALCALICLYYMALPHKICM